VVIDDWQGTCGSSAAVATMTRKRALQAVCRADVAAAFSPAAPRPRRVARIVLDSGLSGRPEVAAAVWRRTSCRLSRQLLAARFEISVAQLVVSVRCDAMSLAARSC